MTRILGSYFSATRHPWPILVFLLPLLATYEVGVFHLGGSNPDALRNGADTWLRWGLESFGLPHLYWAPALVVAVFLLGAWIRWIDRPEDLLLTWLGMLVESILFALLLFALSRELAPILKRLGMPLTMALSSKAAMSRTLTFIGAGIYEETLFRLGLFAILGSLLSLMGFSRSLTLGSTAVLSALIFSAAHHVGPNGEPFQSFVFWFRAVAGLYFGLLYQLRGFGIAVGAHAGYDILVGVLLA